MTSKQLIQKYGVPVYRSWNDVPQELHTKTSAKRLKVKIPDDAKPDGIKNSASPLDPNSHYLLFNINKYKP